jgi:hypothetical protein
MDEIERQLGAIHLTSDISIRQRADDAFVHNQLALLESTKALLRIYKERDEKTNGLRSEALKVLEYEEMITRMIPEYVFPERVKLNEEKYRKQKAHIATILSPDEFAAHTNMMQYAHQQDPHPYIEYHTRYHRMLIEARLMFMSRRCSKRAWLKRALMVHREYETFEIDMASIVQIGNHVATWFNEANIAMDYGTYMWVYRLVYHTLERCNMDAHRKHRALEHKVYSIIDDNWKRVDADENTKVRIVFPY